MIKTVSESDTESKSRPEERHLTKYIRDGILSIERALRQAVSPTCEKFLR